MVTFAILCQGCLNRAEIRARTWLNNADAMAELCKNTPALGDYGFYRRLNDGTIEFVAFCDPKAQHMIGVIDQDFNNILDQLLPGQK